MRRLTSPVSLRPYPLGAVLAATIALAVAAPASAVTFTAPAQFSVGGAGTQPYGIASGDVNVDGRPDLVTANNGTGAVSVVLGNGDGTFGPAATFASGPVTRAVALADLNADGRPDFNGDGKPDLVTANLSSGDVSLLLGNGDGTFAAATSVSPGAGIAPERIAVSDVNARRTPRCGPPTPRSGCPG